jgi:hypothetical protein
VTIGYCNARYMVMSRSGSGDHPLLLMPKEITVEALGGKRQSIMSGCGTHSTTEWVDKGQSSRAAASSM